jgi:hypothetical protein
MESVRQDKWQQAQASKEAYKQNFSEFTDFNNSASFEEIEEDITDTYKKINTFIENRNYSEIAFSWLESRGKISAANSIKLYKENEHVKKNSRFFESYKTKRSEPTLRTGTSPAAEGLGSIPADNRAGEKEADNIKWDKNSKRGSYTFRTYTEDQEAPHIQTFPEPKESQFSKDKDKVKSKKNRFTDAPTVSQRMRNVSGVGPEFDTRQQGTVYSMSGLGDVTYREQVEHNRFLESFNDPADSEMGVSGTAGSATNKEPMENPKDKMGVTYNKKKNGVKK